MHAERGLAAFPGQNGKIAFFRGEIPTPGRYVLRGDLWVMEADGSDQRLLLRRVDDASFSPDGRRLVLLRGSALRSTVTVARADGSHRRRLTKPGFYTGLGFTANGRSVLVSRVDTGTSSAFPNLRYAARSSIYKLSLRGGRPRRLARPHGVVFGLSQSPNGSRLAVQRVAAPRPGADPGAELFTIGMDGRNRRRLHTAPSSLAAGILDFSPDGRSLVFGSMLVTPALVSDSARTEQLPGTESATDYIGLWSPDGRLIVFARYLEEPGQEGAEQVHLIPSDGGVATRLTHSNSVDVPLAWQPLP